MPPSGSFCVCRPWREDDVIARARLLAPKPQPCAFDGSSPDFLNRSGGPLRQKHDVYQRGQPLLPLACPRGRGDSIAATSVLDPDRQVRMAIMFEGWDAVVLGPGAIRIHDVVSHRVSGLLDRIGQLSRGAGSAVACDRARSLHQPVQLLAENLRRRLRHGRGVGHRDVLPVRHQLVGFRRQDWPGRRPADGL